MTEATTVSTPKPKKPVASAAPIFETPKFEVPRFDIPSMEMPAAFREMAEKGLAQAKDNYEKMKSAAEQATDVLEETYSTASKGCSDLGLKLIGTARTNTNAAFDLYGDLITAKSLAEVVEKSTAYLRAQFDTLTAQAKELTECAQKVANATAEPMKESISSFNKANT